MSDANENRRDEAGLDASLSVLGDEGKEPKVGRLGPAPQPQAESALSAPLRPGQGSAAGGTSDLTGRRAAKESIRDVAGDVGKG